MKCERCGYDDHGTGDTAHVCQPIRPTMTTPTEAERMAALPELPKHLVAIDQSDDQMWGEIQEHAWDSDYSLKLGDPLYTAEQMHAFRAEGIAALEKENAELRQQIARLTDRKFLRHGGNGISLNCSRKTIDLFVSRAIEHKDDPLPTPEQIKAFRTLLDGLHGSESEGQP